MDAQQKSTVLLPLHAQIEGYLFWKSETVSIKEISKALNKNEDEINTALEALKNSLLERGLALIHSGENIELRTSPALSSFIETLTKEELDRDLGKAGIETLSIVLYEGPISRKDIDYIRGVNSQFIVRNLLVRGLIERVQNNDARSFLYKPTTELFAHLGVSSEKDLPEYLEFKEEIQRFKESADETVST